MLHQILSGHEGSLTACIFLPDGNRVLSAANDSSFRVWERDGTCSHVVEGMKYTVRCLAVCKLLGLVYLGDSSGAIQILQAKDFSFSRTQEGSKQWGWVVCVAVGSNGQYMACCYQHGQCRVVDAQSGDEFLMIDDASGALPLCVSFSDDCKWMCLGYDDGHATMFSVSKFSIERKHTMAVSRGGEGGCFYNQLQCFAPFLNLNPLHVANAFAGTQVSHHNHGL